MDKHIQIMHGKEHIEEILHEINPYKQWTIIYIPRLDHPEEYFTSEQIRMNGIAPGDSYFIIREAKYDVLLYTINVTGDSALCALKELMNLCANKF